MHTTLHISVGVASILIAAGMIIIGRPDKHGVSPKFMLHPAAFALYPVTVLTLVAFGAVALIAAFVSGSP